MGLSSTTHRAVSRSSEKPTQTTTMYAARLALPAARTVAVRSQVVARPMAVAPLTRSFQTTTTSKDIDSAALIIGYARNPSLKQQLFSYAILGFALSEAMGLFC